MKILTYYSLVSLSLGLIAPSLSYGQEAQNSGKVISHGSHPNTESWEQMRERSLLKEQQNSDKEPNLIIVPHH